MTTGDHPGLRLCNAHAPRLSDPACICGSLRILLAAPGSLSAWHHFPCSAARPFHHPRPTLSPHLEHPQPPLLPTMSARKRPAESSVAAAAAAAGASEKRARPLVDDSDKHTYQSGFGNEFATEALKGALPVGQNSPQVVRGQGNAAAWTTHSMPRAPLSPLSAHTGCTPNSCLGRLSRPLARRTSAGA